MPSFPNKSSQNPLSAYMRQPKIYIRLPSNGNWWPAGSIDITETGEFPVYSMTAKDELIFKTPDALMNGQAMVDVIQSCIPNIKNAWEIPSIDLDTILIAIRIATYGEKMSFSHKVPVIDEELDFDLDLRILLDQQSQNVWIDQLVINEEFIIFIKPVSYKNITQASIKTFETNRILMVVNDDSIPDHKKLEIFNTSFNMLTNATITLVGESIFKVVTSEFEVTDKNHILEFIQNVDKEVFVKIQDHINELKTKNELKPLEFSTTEEQQNKGAPATYKVPLNFNNSDFFGRGF